MSSASPPFPPSGSFLKSIRESSQLLCEKSNVRVTEVAIKRLLFSQAFAISFKRVSAFHGLAFPLKFASTLAELNLLSVLSLLNFASGYRIQLHTETGRGAWDNIRLLIFSLFLTSSTGGEGDLLSARGMQDIQEQKVAELMRVSLHVERPHESIPGVTVGEIGGPMHELVKLITGTLNETGLILVGAGYPDLGSFVLEALQEGEKAKSKDKIGADVDVILEQLVRAIPAFRDMSVVDGQPIYCFKKALFLIHAVLIRFGSMSPPPFPIPDTSQVPVFTDNVLPSLLIHLGVIDLSSASHGLEYKFPDAGSLDKLSSLLAEASPCTDTDNAPKAIPPEGPTLTVNQSYILRAAAIHACELIVDVARSPDIELPENLEWIRDITLPLLDMWLWSVAKDRPDYRQLERFALKNTVFF
ncbi:hypothetical protein PILCRDRAFT_809971 [Piloderma croceum F 1598]|uniref:Queuosine 5'-phosphate N-glycosylase/hydrolase n=1 Tax=Piloderma croceum (strain F 1598) TaxID=765440 RepID=A0A0C3GK23_PILCF|nr:hypothetical protein PILCRDRAFT_809971 [Piloderma croceum F 1598]